MIDNARLVWHNESMLERSSKGQTPKDPDEIAAFVVATATSESNGKNPHAVALGRLGGKKGGITRAKRLSSEERSAIARKAALARWHSKA